MFTISIQQRALSLLLLRKEKRRRTSPLNLFLREIKKINTLKLLKKKLDYEQ